MGAGAGMDCVCSGWGWGRPQEEDVRLAPSPEKHRKLLALLGIVELSFAKRSVWGPCLTTGIRAGWAGPEVERVVCQQKTGAGPEGRASCETPHGWEAERHGPTQDSDVC